MSYFHIPLLAMEREIGREETKKLISSFTCPRNPDIVNYLKKSAIAHAAGGITQTHLIFAKKENVPVMIAYFTIMPKTLFISDKSVNQLPPKTKAGIVSSAAYDEYRKQYELPATLIVQISKNFTDNANRMISGADLLEIALGMIKKAQSLTGGSIVYAECNDNKKLIEYYKPNGFAIFGERLPEASENDRNSGKMIKQMLKIID